MINREELQRLLREFGGPLATVEVKPQSEIVFTAEHDVKVCFLASVYGNPEWVEAELDLRSIRDVNDVAALAGKILEALEARAAAAKSETTVH